MAQPPSPTQSQIQGIQNAKALAESGVDGAAQAIQGFQDAIAVYQDIDNFAKALFDFYSAIIRNYELEVRYMNGLIVADPIVEQDIIDLVNETGRLYNGTLEAERIDEFDGQPLEPTNDEYELNLFDLQDIALDRLQNGLTNFNTSLNPSATTDTSLDENSTTLEIATPDTETIVAGERLLITNGTDAAVVEVVTSSQGGSCSGEDNPPQTDQASCEADNGTWNAGNVILTITVIIPPQGTISAGASIGQKSFDGFTNAERTTKTATDPDLQPIMDTLLADLQDKLERRKTVLQLELAAIQANDNDDINPQAEINVQASISAIDGFLGVTPPSTIDISDSGITAINSEKTTRTNQISARIPEIATEISEGNFYDLRFQQAAQRGQIANGHLAQLNALQEALSNAQSGATTAQDLADRYASMLPN